MFVAFAVAVAVAVVVAIAVASAVAVAVAVAVAIAVALAHRSYICVTTTNVFGLAFALLASSLRAYKSTALTIMNAKIGTTVVNWNGFRNGFICNANHINHHNKSWGVVMVQGAECS